MFLASAVNRGRHPPENIQDGGELGVERTQTAKMRFRSC